MSDMTMQNAIHCMKAIICEEVCEECDYYGKTGTDHCEADAVRMAIKALEEQPQWIPCSERLPERGNEVLVCYDFKGHRSVLIGTLYGDEKFHGYDDEYLTPEGRKYRKAVAWMPLPKPYGGDAK